MTDKPEMPLRPATADRAHAPLVFFDSAPAFGHYNGIVAITLTVNLARPAGGEGITNDDVVAAYLRTNLQGVLALRDAINSVLLLAAPAENEAKN